MGHVFGHQFPRSSFWKVEVLGGQVYLVTYSKQRLLMMFSVRLMSLNDSTLNDGVVRHFKILYCLVYEPLNPWFSRFDGSYPINQDRHMSVI